MFCLPIVAAIDTTAIDGDAAVAVVAVVVFPSRLLNLLTI
jgi:hypothetical protein